MNSQTIRIAHVSDPHFGTTDENKKNALRERLLQLAPDWIVISGDITQRARRSQFTEAREFCRSLSPIEIIAVPGNHDIALFNAFERFISPYRGFERTLGFPIRDRRKRGPFEVIACNSTDRFRHIQGELGAEDLRRIGNYSDESAVRIAVFHQPLDCPKPQDEKNLLRDRDESVPRLQSSKVDLVLSGHIHDPLVISSASRYPEGHKFVISVAGTCLSSRTRSFAPNSFHFVEIETGDETAMAITRYDLLKEEFDVRAVSNFVRRAGSWESMR